MATEPGLSTRIDTDVFWAAPCCATALSVPPGDASAAAEAALSWLTDPSSPGEKTRTETVVFATPSCVASDVASAVAADGWSESVVAAAAPVATFACETPSSSPGLPTLTTIEVFATSVCVALAAASAPCTTVTSPGPSTADAVDASASADARFSCPTFLPFPGSSTRTVTAVLSTSFWSADAVASAFCPTDAPWSAAAAGTWSC